MVYYNCNILLIQKAINKYLRDERVRKYKRLECFFFLPPRSFVNGKGEKIMKPFEEGIGQEGKIKC